MRSAINFRPIAFLGVLSYSLYLVHQVVIAVVEHELAAFGGTTRFARSRSVLPLRGFCTLPSRSRVHGCVADYAPEFRLCGRNTA